MPYNADNYRVPMREMLSLNIQSFGRRPGLYRYHDASARKEIAKKIQAKSGKRYVFPLPDGYLNVGTGPNIKFSSDYRLWGTATFDGQYNVARSITLGDLTYEISPMEFKDRLGSAAGEGFATKLDQRFAQELTGAQHMVVFNPADPGRSMQQVASKFRRYGISGKPVIALSDNVMDSIDYYQSNSMNEGKGVSVYRGKFREVESQQDIPNYYTGDRAGACPVVYGGCQSGCELFVDFGAGFENRLVAYAGEVVEIEGVNGVIERTQKRTGQRLQLRLERDVWTDGNGLAALKVYPHLRPQGVAAKIGENHYGQDVITDAHSNATCAPADGARVYFSPGLKPNTIYEQSIAWHEQMITLVTPPIVKSTRFSESMPIKVKEGGTISNISSLQYTIDLDQTHGPTEIHRLDMMLDVLVKQRELGVRLVGPELGTIEGGVLCPC